MSELPLWIEDVRPEWVDYNGHLNEAYYVLVFSHATDAVLARLGITPESVVDTGTSLYTLEAHVRYLDQVPPGARLEVRSSVIGVTAKLLWLWHEMWSSDDAGGPARLRATGEFLGVHVDSRVGRASPFPDALRAQADALVVPPPEHASRRIAL
jgi:acyl-CoA thioester hydrolase